MAKCRTTVAGCRRLLKNIVLYFCLAFSEQQEKGLKPAEDGCLADVARHGLSSQVIFAFKQILYKVPMICNML
jgi:hypothetical protein